MLKQQGIFTCKNYDGLLSISKGVFMHFLVMGFVMTTSPNSKSRKLRNKAIAKAKAWADERRKTKKCKYSLRNL